MSKKKTHKKPDGHKTHLPSFVEKYWDIGVIVLLILLPLIYFSSFLSPDRMLAGPESDFLKGGYSLDKWTFEQDQFPPLWYPHMFGGYPALGAPSAVKFAPLTFVVHRLLRFPPHIAMTIFFIIALFLAGLGMYFYLKEIGVSPYVAAVGAVMYQFIGNIATAPYAGHAGRALSAATFPLMLFFLHRGLTTRRLWYFILLSAVTAFAFYEAHFQLTYYALLFFVVYLIYFLVRHRKTLVGKDYIKIFGYGLITVVFIWTLMAASWLPVIGGLGTAARGVERGYEYATSWAMPSRELIDLVIPTYSGILKNYWGANHFKIHSEYFGLFAIVFAVFSIVLFWKKPYVKFFAITTFATFFVALGSATPFFRIFYTIIPGFRLFRAPSLSFFIISFGFIVLAAIGFHNMLAAHNDKKHHQQFQKRLYIIGGILLGILLLVGLICTLGRDAVLQSMQNTVRMQFARELGEQGALMKMNLLKANYSAFVSGIWRSILFVALILGLIFIAMKRRLAAWICALCAITVTLVDQLPIVAQYRKSAPAPTVYYAADDAVDFLQRDNGIYRVFPFNYEHAIDVYLLYHNIQSAGGYISNPISRYQDFIGAGKSVMFNPINLVRFPRFLDLLNVKYIIAPSLPADVSRYNPQTQMNIRYMRQYLQSFRPVHEGMQYSVYSNDNTLPRAYVVPHYIVLEEEEIVRRLSSDAFDPRTTVILEEYPEEAPADTSFPMVAATITDYSANRVTCTTNASYSGFLVLTDNFHPDWKAFVDGNAATLYQANYTFRAVSVPAGQHTIVFEYISRYFNIGWIITIVSIFVLVGLFAVALKFRM